MHIKAQGKFQQQCSLLIWIALYSSSKQSNVLSPLITSQKTEINIKLSMLLLLLVICHIVKSFQIKVSAKWIYKCSFKTADLYLSKCIKMPRKCKHWTQSTQLNYANLPFFPILYGLNFVFANLLLQCSEGLFYVCTKKVFHSWLKFHSCWASMTVFNYFFIPQIW